VVGFYDDLHVLIEGDEEAQKALRAENWRKSPLRSLETFVSYLGGSSPVHFLRGFAARVLVPFPILWGGRGSQNPKGWRSWNPTSRKKHEKWGPLLFYRRLYGATGSRALSKL